MKDDPASLDKLRPIVEPIPVSWWPLATGWWLLFALLAVIAIVLAYRAWRQWRSNAYRRAAMQELRATDSPWVVSEILKRTALCAFPRSVVASSSGDPWCRWLGETSGLEMSESVSLWFTDGIYHDRPPADPSELVEFIEQWIRQHQRPEATPPPHALSEDSSHLVAEANR